MDLPFPFTLPRLFRNPAISIFFPFPLGLRNSGVRLYLLFIFCLPVIVLFDDKFDTGRFTAAVRHAFFDTLLSNLDESKESTKVQKEIIDKLHQKIQQKKKQQVKYGIFFKKAGG